MKVLLGDNSGCEWVQANPSRSGLRTVLDVLKIQMNFWPTLVSCLTKLQSQSEICAAEDKSKISLCKFPS